MGHGWEAGGYVLNSNMTDFSKTARGALCNNVGILLRLPTDYFTLLIGYYWIFDVIIAPIIVKIGEYSRIFTIPISGRGLENSTRS